MDFSNWLNIEEAVRGAFGNDPREKARKERERQMAKQQPLNHTPNPETRVVPATPTQRHDNRFQRIDQRVTYGKGIEKQIFDSLVACGMNLREPTSSEDMYDKIDGWWNEGGTEKPIQIKYRDTGDDILFEVMKDYNRQVPGRDMVGKAVYYAVLTRAGGSIVIVEVDQAKNLIKAALTAVQHEGFDRQGNYRTTGGLMLRVRQDPQSGQEKLMAYIPVSLLRNVRPPCRANVRF